MPRLLLALALLGIVVPGLPARGEDIRFATFNIRELSATKLGRVDERGQGTDPQLRKAAEIVQRVRPDVLLVNEIDFDPDERRCARLFLERYLRVSQSGQPPVDYTHVVFEPVNTGVPTGLDLNNDGKTDGPDDAYGFGRYEGQYGMVLYSRFEIDRERMRTFRMFKWRDMPGNLMPDGSGGKPAWYSPDAAAVLRLSSKSHWDVPLTIGSRRVHVLASHPTPPVFDGPEDRNGRRNHDEIRLWADYIAGGQRAAYLVDDQARRGGLPEGAVFVIMGDLNSDPEKGEKIEGRAAVEQLLGLQRVQDPRPRHGGTSDSANESALLKTAEFGRVDYVLPSSSLKVKSAGVFWPSADDALLRLVSKPEPASDHRLVYVNVSFQAGTTSK